MAVESISLTGGGASSSDWGNSWWGLAYHASTSASLEYSPDAGVTWYTAPDSDGADATWTAAGHKTVLIPAGSLIRAITDDITVYPMAASTTHKSIG